MQYQIGDFAKMAQLTHRQLKYYEQCGLLTPVRVDGSSGYRFYEARQLMTVAHIRAFLGMGFTTHEIKALLNDADYAQAFDAKRAQLEADIEENKRRLGQLTFYRDAMLNGGFNQPYRATIKTTISKLAAARRRVFKDVSDMSREWGVLLEELKRVGAAPTPNIDTAAQFYDDEFAMEYFDAELMLFLSKRGGDSPMFEYKQPEPERAVCVVHRGGYDFINEAYAFAYMFIDKGGYSASGRPIERYIVGPYSGKPEGEFVTELYVPIAVG